MENLALAAILILTAAPEVSYVDFLKEAECRGKFSEIILRGGQFQREKLAAFLELRRRGKIPPFDRQWCLDRGILPFQKTKEKPT